MSAVSVAVLAGRPELVAQAGVLRWTEWGYDASSPGWIDVEQVVTSKESLPSTVLTWVLPE